MQPVVQGCQLHQRAGNVTGYHKIIHNTGIGRLARLGDNSEFTLPCHRVDHRVQELRGHTFQEPDIGNVQGTGQVTEVLRQDVLPVGKQRVGILGNDIRLHLADPDVLTGQVIPVDTFLGSRSIVGRTECLHKLIAGVAVLPGIGAEFRKGQRKR